MIWVKALHVIFMVTWFAGLFYLPRLFVYHVAALDKISQDRFVVMEKKLFAIMSIGAVLTVIFGVWMLVDYAWAAYGKAMWLHIKLLFVLLLVLFHGYCYKIMQDFRQGINTKSEKFFRLLNELPVLTLFVAIIMVVVRPL